MFRELNRALSAGVGQQRVRGQRMAARDLRRHARAEEEGKGGHRLAALERACVAARVVEDQVMGVIDGDAASVEKIAFRASPGGFHGEPLLIQRILRPAGASGDQAVFPPPALVKPAPEGCVPERGHSPQDQA